MKIQITKHADGEGLLRCVREDGSMSWQKQNRHGAFFAKHDLTHFAVESTLGYRRGFFGLVSEGWDIEDTTGQGSRGRLPDEATEVERLVGLLDAERAGGELWTVDDFDDAFGGSRRLMAEELEAVRSRRDELLEQWSRVEVGGMMELEFG
jgi:hypothetical protein